MTQPAVAAEFEVRLIDPKGVRIANDPFDRLVAELAGAIHENVRFVRAFPLTAASSSISVLDAEGKELGMIEDISQLDAASRGLLEKSLHDSYLTTRVLSIAAVTSNHGLTTWDLMTTRGRRTVHVRDRVDIRSLSTTRVVLTDVNGMKFEIASIPELDAKSQTLLEAEM